MRKVILLTAIALLASAFGCGRFANQQNETAGDRVVVISPIYNEIIWALGAQDKVVGVDLSSTYPPEIKNVTTVGYHRALSAEGILSLHPTAILTDGNIGPPQSSIRSSSSTYPRKLSTQKTILSTARRP